MTAAERSADWEDRIDIHEPLAEICRRLDLDPKYIAQLDITPDQARVVLYRGRNGRCIGPKYIDETTDEPAMETLTFQVRA